MSRVTIVNVSLLGLPRFWLIEADGDLRLARLTPPNIVTMAELALEEFGLEMPEGLVDDDDFSTAPSAPVKVNVVMWVNQVLTAVLLFRLSNSTL